MANPTPRSARLCDAGLHSMDPNWDTCPYCEAAKRSKERTQADQSPSPSAVSPDDRKTRVGENPAGIRRETKTMPSEFSPTPVLQAEKDTRRIVGVLITYTWQPTGQLFLIREGKNFIGAGRISSDASHQPCDILIANDTKLSAEHALILCRHGRHDIIDQASSNGTFLSGELVPLQGIEIPNYAEIHTGSTVWTFIKITPPDSEKPFPSAHRDHQESKPEDGGTDKPEKPKRPPTEVG